MALFAGAAGIGAASCRAPETYRAGPTGTGGVSIPGFGGSGGLGETGGSGGGLADAGGAGGDGGGGSGGGPVGGSGGGGGVMDAGGDIPGDVGHGDVPAPGSDGRTDSAPVDRPVVVDTNDGSAGADTGPPPSTTCPRATWLFFVNTQCDTPDCGGLPASEKDPRNAIDGNPATRYTSGRPQGSTAFDEAVTLTFADIVTLSGISLMTTVVGDGPASYRLEYSTNAITFMSFSPQVAGTGSDNLNITFPSRPVRAIRIFQTGVKTVPWWSISEVTVTGCTY